MFFLFFNDTATTEIYTLSLHDALPICALLRQHRLVGAAPAAVDRLEPHVGVSGVGALLRQDRGVLAVRPRLVRGRLQDERSEEHTSELQSRQYLVCRLLLEKKKENTMY